MLDVFWSPSLTSQNFSRYVEFENRERWDETKRTGSVLTFDTGDARTGGGELQQDFEKLFFGRCHLALYRAGDADGIKR
jgi:hypothetical protein